MPNWKIIWWDVDIRAILTSNGVQNSVERVVHYASFVEQEAPQTLMDAEPQPESWPTAGRVEFKDVVLKYRPELPAVLKGLSIGVAGGEKIGIVGRTGAGKSSIMTALFRIVEVAEGQISIDGIDLANLGLMDVRRSMSIIPQDPLLCKYLYKITLFKAYINLQFRELFEVISILSGNMKTLSFGTPLNDHTLLKTNKDIQSNCR